MVKLIPHNRPLISPADEQAVQGVLKSGQIAQGQEVEGLESDFVAMLAGGSACAVSSGSAGLYLALYALGVGRGSKVAVPTYACSALLNAVHLAGATPYVVDVKPDCFTIDPARMGDQAPDAEVAIAVHCFGASADVGSLDASGIKVIEDCCHSLGGPQAQTGEAAVFSFYATKIITGGYGGLVWDSSGRVAEKVLDFRQHDCRANYIPRFNFQMSDIQAAMIRSQLSRLKEIINRRRTIYELYKKALPDTLSVQIGLSDISITPYRFVVRTEDCEARNRLQRHIRNHGISTIVPIEKYELLHRYMELDIQSYPNAEKIVNTTLSLPLFPGLTDCEVKRVIDAIASFT
jgi:dTDP-4-amino-4,6-dideoxygalactose transaminase